MVHVTIEKKESFAILGVKTWISGTDNELFAKFWQEQTKNGVLLDLNKHRIDEAKSVTKSYVLGLSNTEKDPNVRSFDFYIAVEALRKSIGIDQKYESLAVKPYNWAIFSSDGTDISSLIEAEMYCWTKWLPGNEKYKHDNGPEIEVYFPSGKIEYWVPVIERI